MFRKIKKEKKEEQLMMLAVSKSWVKKALPK